MVLPTKLGPLKASFAVDTSPVVNVLSEKAYRLIKRASRGSLRPLRPTDLNLMGVSSEPLNILGVVRLPIVLGKGTSRLCLDFYVVSDFRLPSDGLLGLTSLKSNQVVIHPDTNVVKFQGESLKAMEKLMRLTAPREQDKDNKTGTFRPQAVAAVQVPSPVSSSNKDTVKTGLNGNWKQVNATVIGNHEIPDRTAMHTHVSVPSATVGCDICLEVAGYVKRLQ